MDLSPQPQDEAFDLWSDYSRAMVRRTPPTSGPCLEPHGYSRGQPGPCAWHFFSSSPKTQLELKALPEKAL